jgi:CheY-like chemotaxis protein
MNAQINPGRPSGTCLIVEDSEFDRERMCRVVRKTRAGMQIAEVATLSRARETLQKGGINLILLDNHLPDGLGAEFAQELAQDPRSAGIPIIIVSDWPTPFMWEKAASAGVIYVLSKSEFDSRYMRAALDALPRRRVN